jgi:hypothetical protein
MIGSARHQAMNSSRLRMIGFTVLGVLAISRPDGAIAADTSANPSPGPPKTSVNPKIEKAFISLRIGTPQWMPDNRYRDLLALFEIGSMTMSG